MTEGERATGTPNTIYNVASVLFHSLQAGASYDTYIEDAEREGDEELTEFFRRVSEEDRDRAAEARMLLAERTPTATRTEGATAGASPRAEPSTDLLGTEPVREDASAARTGKVPPAEEVPSGAPPQAPPGDVQRETSDEPRPRSEETSTGAEGASLDTPLSQEEMIRRQAERDRGEADKGLTDEVRDAVFDEEERGREGIGGEDRR